MKTILLLIAGALLHRYRKEIGNKIGDTIEDAVASMKGDEYVEEGYRKLIDMTGNFISKKKENKDS